MDSFGRLPMLSCVFALLLPASAQAECTQWDATGGWAALQGNNTRPLFSLQQTGSALTGTGRYTGWQNDEHSGSVGGTLNGRVLELTAYWDNGTIGIYSGIVDSQGRITGKAYERQHPSAMEGWISDRVLNCVTATPVVTAPRVPPVALGRVHTTDSAPAQSTSICAVARSARARNSPAAPGLERQCAAQGAAHATGSSQPATNATQQP
jgi:hypothetical protein